MTQFLIFFVVFKVYSILSYSICGGKISNCIVTSKNPHRVLEVHVSVLLLFKMFRFRSDSTMVGLLTGIVWLVVVGHSPKLVINIYESYQVGLRYSVAGSGGSLS